MPKIKHPDDPLISVWNKVYRGSHSMDVSLVSFSISNISVMDKGHGPHAWYVNRLQCFQLNYNDTSCGVCKFERFLSIILGLNLLGKIN